MARVLMLGNFSLYNKGTMRARALPLARALVRRGHSARLVLPALDAPQAAGTLANVDGVEVLHLPIQGPPGLRQAATVQALVREARRGPPDVVHAFKPISFAGAAGACLWALSRLRLSGARLVVDADDWEGTGGWAELERRPLWQRWLVDRQERWGLRHCTALTVASRHLATLAWALGVPRDRVHYIPNGVERVLAPADEEQRRVARCRLGLDDGPVVLLYTRFFEFAQRRVVGVLRETARRLPDVKLLVVGRGFHGEERELARLAQEAGLASAVVFAGWVEAGELPVFFAAADVAMYPFADTLVNRTKCPAKLVELLAAGVPVVADDVGQTGEYVGHGGAGLLVPPDDEEGFARALIDLLTDAELRRRVGRAAAERVASEFLWDGLAPRAELAYGLAGNLETAGGQVYV